MHFAELLGRDLDVIVDEWAEFAKTNLPAAAQLTPKALRDSAADLLIHVGRDMATDANASERHEKARGRRPDNAPELTVTARKHAAARFSDGFTMNELVAEFRALRASVVRRWLDAVDEGNRGGVHELVRFNESIDQAQGESIACYTASVEEARNLLLGVLGHDLRNPLAAVHASAQYLSISEGLDAGQSKAVARILNGSSRMQQMIADLLDFARTRLGTRLPVAIVACDFGEACERAVDEIRAFHPHRTIDLERRGRLDGNWDPGRAAQLVSNLVGNAIQHGAEGKTVSVSVDGTGEDVVMRVRNLGPAIPAEEQKALFDPLVRRSLARRRRPDASGLGLGLYIARQIALAHGGTIAVDSSDEGTTFCARLPRHGHAG